MAITADDLLRNVRRERPSLLEPLARLADPAGSMQPPYAHSDAAADERALASDLQVVANDVHVAFEELRAEVDERP